MSLCEVHWFSRVLEKQVGMYVLLPDKGKPPFPTFYLLHGLSDDYATWHRRSRIEWYVRDLPLIVVMPDGFRGFYTDHNQGRAYARYMAEEIPAFVERNFPAKASRSGRCIGGLSMGGYGALRLALGYPDRYLSATSHSGALGVGKFDFEEPLATEFYPIFGPRPAGTKHDLVHLARLAAKAGRLPRLRIDCGTEDFLLEQNRCFHHELKRLKVPHQYQEFPGAHTWDYWDLHVQEAIEFHRECLKLKRT